MLSASWLQKESDPEARSRHSRTRRRADGFPTSTAYLALLRAARATVDSRAIGNKSPVEANQYVTTIPMTVDARMKPPT